MEKQIRLDVSNMFAEKIGSEQGLNREQVDDFQKKADQIHRYIREAKKEGKMGFMELPFQDHHRIEEIENFAAQRKSEIENFVVLGIGGSALGSIALQTALKDPYHNIRTDVRNDTPRLFVPDNVDPVRFGSLLDELDLEKTLFNVISKSGGTAETMSQFLITRQAVIEELGKESLKDHFVATTSQESGYLIEIAEQEGIPTFPIPDNVGGRFSVLSPVGLLFGAFAGLDIFELLSGARFMDELCSTADLWDNPAYLNALLEYLAYQEGKKMSVMFPYAHRLKDVADWYRQLWAESLGKEVDRDGKEVNVGPTPIKALGATDQHSQVQLYMEGPYDKIINFLEVKNFERKLKIPDAYQEIEGVSYLGGHSLNHLLQTEKKATELALTKRQRLNKTIIIPEIQEHTLGQLFYLLELQTAFIGELFNINVYNQPGVELGKSYAYGILGRKGYQEMKSKYDKSPDHSEEFIV